jgi:hypothetical protein
VLAYLDQWEAALTVYQVNLLVTAAQTEVSPWLETARWHQYLRDQLLKDLVALTVPYDPLTKPLLMVVCESLKQNMELAYHAVCEDKINLFNQRRINTF